MIKLDDNVKAFLRQYIGTDGKLIIDESLPEDLQEAFREINEKMNPEQVLNMEEIDFDSLPDDVETDDEDPVEQPALAEKIVPDIAPPPITAEKAAEINKNLEDLDEMF